MKEFPMKVTIRQQVNKSEETYNYLAILFQDDTLVLVTDIQAHVMTHNIKKKA